MILDCMNKDCDKCPKKGTCTESGRVEAFRQLFSKYGYYHAETCDKRIYIYEHHPEQLNTQTEIIEAFKHSQMTIKQLEYTISQLKAYQMALTEQYNFITTSPTKEKIKLSRYCRYSDRKVFYYIKFYIVNLNNNHEELTETITYSGRERKQALEHFESLQKEHKNATFEKDIAPACWEK